MNPSTQIANHFRGVFFSGNWTVSNLRDQLADVTWQQATTQVYGLNTIATLAYHISYFVSVQLRVLEGGPLEGSDSLSFNHPPINSQEDWEQFLQERWAEAESLAAAIEQLPEEKLWQSFADDKYGTYYRNLHGIIEHSHYHLGQIAIIKKIVGQHLNKSV